MRRHTDYENMVAAYDGLSPAERKEMDRHLAECPACKAELAAYRQMDGEIRAARALKPSAGLRIRFSDAISGASLSSAAAKPTDHVRLAPPEPKIVVRRPTPGVPGGWLARLALPAAAVLLFVVSVWASLHLPGGTESGRSISAPPAQATITKVRFLCNTIKRTDELGEVIRAFEAENPEIDIEFVGQGLTVPDPGTADPNTAYAEAVRNAAENFDVFCALPMASDWQAGVVQDLAPYIAADPPFRPDDFYAPFSANLASTGGVLWVPTYFRVPLIGYNPAMFDAAGLPFHSRVGRGTTFLPRPSP